MNYLRSHWYYFSLAIGIAIFAFLAVFWSEFSVLQRLSIANLAVIFIHFFEEFGYPGGFGKLANTLYYKNEGADITRYPLNQNMVMIGNWAFAVLFYIPPIFFPHLIWLGLMPMLFGGVAQLVLHGIVNNRLLGTWYNSGLASTVLGHLPLFIAYVYVVHTNGLVTIWDWGIAVVYAVAAYFIVMRKFMMDMLKDKNSPYPFTAEEMARFDRLYGRKGAI